nr:tripartite motif-containing protein 2-like [Ciona intestinalis]|eukprot:XP_026692935.1 tripartite motif-containing protein 2-like [Ciona intestinalis]
MSEWSMVNSYNHLGCAVGQFDNARGFDLSVKCRTLTVTDINNKRIQVVDDQGKYLHHWSVTVNGLRLCPLNLRRQDNEVVAAVVEGCAVLYNCPNVTDFQGITVKLLHTFGNDDLVFPRSILVNSKDQYVISDVGRQRVTVHDVYGKVLRAIGHSEDTMRFNWPYYMCADSKGRIAVSDSHNRCVKLFDEKDFKFISSFGENELTCATGVCESLDGRSFYVGDYDTKSLIEYSTDGKYIGHIDKKT